MIIKSVSKETKMFHSQHLALIKRYLLSTVEEKMVNFVSHKNANVRKSLSFLRSKISVYFHVEEFKKCTQIANSLYIEINETTDGPLSQVGSFSQNHTELMVFS